MPARFLKGTEIRKAIFAEIKQEVEAIKAAHGVVPGLVTSVVGSNPVSLSYVSLKIKTARTHGKKSARQLQRWLVESDVADDPQAFIISPEPPVELARVICDQRLALSRRCGRGAQGGGVAARRARRREVAHRAQRDRLVRHHARHAGRTARE